MSSLSLPPPPPASESHMLTLTDSLPISPSQNYYKTTLGLSAFLSPPPSSTGKEGVRKGLTILSPHLSPNITEISPEEVGR